MSREWTGGRLDDLNHRVGEGFARVDADLRAVRSETMAMRNEISTRLEATNREMNARFEASSQEMNTRFEAMQRLIIQVGGGIIATMAIGFFSVIATQLL